MFNHAAKTVLLKPKSRTERAARARYSAAATLWSSTYRPDIMRAVAAIFGNGQSWGKKWERIRAEFWLGNVTELYSARNFRRLGVRQTVCVCAPGIGHNAK